MFNTLLSSINAVHNNVVQTAACCWNGHIIFGVNSTQVSLKLENKFIINRANKERVILTNLPKIPGSLPSFFWRIKKSKTLLLERVACMLTVFSFIYKNYKLNIFEINPKQNNSNLCLNSHQLRPHFLLIFVYFLQLFGFGGNFCI